MNPTDILNAPVRGNVDQALYLQRSKSAFSWVVYCLAFFTLMPVIWLLISWGNIDQAIWEHLFATQLWGLIWNTLRLAFGVFIGVAILGTALAWVVTRYEFPGRAVFEWALVLPFAIPAYVFAFIFLGTFDGATSSMASFREFTGLNIWPNLRNFGGVLASFIFAFYPYVYLLVRSALKRQGQEIYEVAQTLGYSQLSLFFKVALPIGWPAVVAGSGLAVMEALADFGTVSIFNYQTFTTAIYKSWFGFFSLHTAAQLATLLVFAVIAWRFCESLMLRGRDPAQEKAIGSRVVERQSLSPLARWTMSGLLLLLLLATFLVPVTRLVMWVLESWQPTVYTHFYSNLQNSFVLALSGGFLVVFCALGLAIAARLDARNRVLIGTRVATLGYALPGSILAVGLMLVFAWLQDQLKYIGVSVALVGSVFVLIFAYLVRFLAVGYSGATTALNQVHPHVSEVAKVLGSTLWQRIWRIYLPLLSPALAASIFMVMVDILKEMPATLLLRPFGWDTLAVSIYGFTAEGDWALAAVPSLALVLIGLIPVYILVKRY